MVMNFDIVCITGTVQGQAKKNNVSIPQKTGKSTVVTHGMIWVKCNASFSCHSSSSHYSTQGFILISFHFIFSFLKNKKIKYYAILHVTSCCVYGYQT